MKHYFIGTLGLHCYRKAVLPEIKSADDNKIELSVKNSVKSYAFVFDYYVNAF